MLKREFLLTLLFLILILAAVTFYPCLNNDFTNWDEQDYVVRNPDIRDFSWAGVRNIFSSFYNANYHPLTMLSYMLEYRFFKLSARAYHTTNLMLHLLNIALVFGLAFVLTGSIAATFITGILFAVHPLHVEPVAWIAGRKDLLYGFFFLGSLVFYAYYLNTKSGTYYFLSLLAFMLSLLSKVTAISLPVILLLMDFYFERKLDKKAWIEKIPFLQLALIFMIAGAFGQYAYRTVIDTPLVTFFYKLVVAGYTVALYLLHTIYPLRLSCLYSFPVAREIFRPQFLLAAFLIGVLIIAVIFSKKHTRRIIFGSFFFLIIIIPILQLIPFGSSIASDRHAYIALFGLFFLAGVSFDWLYRRRFKYRRVVTISLTIYLVASFLALSYLSWQRCKIWKDGLTLWTDVLKKYPDSPIAYNNRGLAYHSRGEYEKAIADFSRALSITPNYIQPLLNRALLYALKGDFDLALSDYSRVIEINPRFGQAYVCRALIYVFKKDYARARNDVNRAIGLGCKVDPELARGISENTCK